MQRFPSGQVVMTPGFSEAVWKAVDPEDKLHKTPVAEMPEGLSDELAMKHHQFIVNLLDRHQSGDWGELLCDEDKQANEDALKQGTRLMSAYDVAGTKVWCITEADRHATTFLLPEEY